MNLARISPLLMTGLVSAWLCGAGLYAAPMEETLQALQKTLQTADDERAKAAGNGATRNSYEEQRSGYMTAQLMSALGREDTDQALSALDQIVGYYRNEAVRKAVASVRKEIAAQATARDEARLAGMRSAIATARKAVASAKVAADMDAAIQALNEVGDRSYGGRNSEALMATSQELSAVRQFAMRWQDYLSAQEAGDAQRARSALESVSSAGQGALLPRSEILSRLAKYSESAQTKNQPSLRDLVGDTVTLQTLPAVVDKLDAFLSQPRRESLPSQFQMLREVLARIRDANASYQAGLPARFRAGRPYSGNGTEEVAAIEMPVRIEFLRVVLPSVLGISDAVKPGETLQAYLDRNLAIASAALDARTMAKILDLQAALVGQNDSSIIRGPMANLLVAQNQDEAGQYMLAALSYQAVLKANNDVISSKIVGERLREIEKAHPEDYRAALDKALQGTTPSVSTISRSSGNGEIIIPGRLDPAEKN